MCTHVNGVHLAQCLYLFIQLTITEKTLVMEIKQNEIFSEYNVGTYCFIFLNFLFFIYLFFFCDKIELEKF